MHTSNLQDLAELRRREAKTTEALAGIYTAQRRLQIARREREVALSKLQAQIALVGAPVGLNHHERR